MNSSKFDVRVVLFDVGGVLVELSGVQTMLGWIDSQISSQELWKNWLTSPSVRAFETGRITPEEFAERLISEMALPVDKDEFLSNFAGWPVGLFPGTLELIARVPSRYVRATLGNSNILHWDIVMNDMRLRDAFDYHFASHLMGMLKPDEEVFRHVSATLGCQPGEILFLDDNSLNIEGAKNCGMNAFQVNGILEAESVLISEGIISNRAACALPGIRNPIVKL